MFAINQDSRVTIPETAGSWLEEISNGNTLNSEKQLHIPHPLHHGTTFIVSSAELKANYGSCNRKIADLDIHSLQTTNAYRFY